LAEAGEIMLARTASRARSLRKNPTAAEQALWRSLRGSALDGLRFRRQHPIDRYVADFACISLKLAIEVDGGVHEVDGRALRDIIRTEVIESRGWRVLRFTNAQVLRDVDRVLAAIHAEAALIRGS
jgi:very-short-patch-repair endonuclease